MNKIFQSFFIFIVKIYRRVISPWTPPSCRFHPTCSAYALEAFQEHGAWKGFKLAVVRISRCHPFGGHGYDPVPKKKKE